MAHQPETPVPATVQTARQLLLLTSASTDDPFERIAASAALGQLSDVVPPYPPAECADTALRGQALVDEAADALIAVLEDADSPDLRGRAFLALEQLLPLPLVLDTYAPDDDVAVRSDRTPT